MMDFWRIRDSLADDLRAGIVPATPEAMTKRVASCAGCGMLQATEHVERFLQDLQSEREKPRKIAPKGTESGRNSGIRAHSASGSIRISKGPTEDPALPSAAAVRAWNRPLGPIGNVPGYRPPRRPGPR